MPIESSLLYRFAGPAFPDHELVVFHGRDQLSVGAGGRKGETKIILTESKFPQQRLGPQIPQLDTVRCVGNNGAAISIEFEIPPVFRWRPRASVKKQIAPNGCL